MYQNYQSCPIVVYHTEDEVNILNWSKSFWLLRSAHRVVFLKVPSNHEQVLDPKTWIETFASEFQNKTALFVPATIRPMTEIDLFTDSHTQNRISFSLDKKLIICCLDPSCQQYELVKIDDVFEDLSSPEGRAHIEEERLVMKDKLFMNV
jgi:hypothetical protein